MKALKPTMGLIVLTSVLLAFSGCVDAGEDVSATHIEIAAALPGTTATIEGYTTTLTDTGGVLDIEPAIRSTRSMLVLERGGERVDLVLDWSADYEALELPADAPLLEMSVFVMEGTDGACVVGLTNGLAATGDRWTGLYDRAVAPCGPLR